MSAVQRFGRTDDVAPLAIRLTSTQADYITEQMIAATHNPGIV